MIKLYKNNMFIPLTGETMQGHHFKENDRIYKDNKWYVFGSPSTAYYRITGAAEDFINGDYYLRTNPLPFTGKHSEFSIDLYPATVYENHKGAYIYHLAGTEKLGIENVHVITNEIRSTYGGILKDRELIKTDRSNIYYTKRYYAYPGDYTGTYSNTVTNEGTTLKLQGSSQRVTIQRIHSKTFDAVYTRADGSTFKVSYAGPHAGIVSSVTPDYSLDAVSVEFDNDIQILERSALANMEQLTAVKLPENLIFIGWGCFESCPAINGSFVLPDKVRYIGPWAFDGCELSDIYLPASIEYIAYGTTYMFDDDWDVGAFAPTCKVQTIYCGFEEGKVPGAPWGAENAKIYYNVKREER